MLDADPRSQPLRLLSFFLAQRKCNLLKLSGGGGPCGARLGPEGATMIREQEEKCWSVTAVRDGELEENPVTTEYARVEEGLTPPPENLLSSSCYHSLLVLHLHQPVPSSRGRPKVIRRDGQN